MSKNTVSGQTQPPASFNADIMSEEALIRSLDKAADECEAGGGTDIDQFYADFMNKHK